MHRREVELEPSRLEGDAERRTCKLQVVDEFVFRQDDFTGQVFEGDLVGVVQESHTLLSAG